MISFCMISYDKAWGLGTLQGYYWNCTLCREIHVVFKVSIDWMVIEFLSKHPWPDMTWRSVNLGQKDPFDPDSLAQTILPGSSICFNTQFNVTSHWPLSQNSIQ